MGIFKNFFISMVIGLIFFAPIGALAFQNDMNTQTNAFAGSQGANFAAPKDPRLVAASLILFALTLVGTLFLVYTVYAGYLILTSAGNEDQISKAKSTIRTAVIGVLVTLSAYGIVKFVSNSLLSSTKVPDGFRAGITNQAGDNRTNSTDPYATDGSTFVPINLQY